MRRELGLLSAVVLVVANMVGTGIFTTSGFILAELGDPKALLWCWLIGGVFAYCGALIYGDLGAMFPEAGGEYVFLRESFGRWAGFLSGWVSLIVGFSAPIAAAAMAFCAYGFGALGLSGEAGWVFTVKGAPVFSLTVRSLAAAFVIFLISLLHRQGLALGARVQNGLTLFKIVMIAIFVGTGFWAGSGSSAHFAADDSSFSVFDTRFAVSLIFVAFAYSGWNAAAYLGGEIRRPERNIPMAMAMGTIAVICLYLLLNALFVYALPKEEMAGALDVGLLAATRLFGEPFGRLFGGAIAFGLLSVLSAMIMAGPRVYYAMAKDRVFFARIGRIAPAANTPAAAVALQGVIAVLLVLTASFEALLVYIGFTLSLFSALTVAGWIRLRIWKKLKGGFARTAAAVFFVAGNLWIMAFSLASRPAAAGFGLATLGLGLAVYLYFSRKERKHTC
ncbi:MAG: amino acid permease [Desulfobacterales bacterium]|nr:amino acid permease [Desulfobacterales bacterium]